MDMLLRNVTMDELAAAYQRHATMSPAPYLRDPACRSRAVARARANGLWDELSNLDPTRDIPVLKRSHFRAFRRTGDRSLPQAAAGARRGELQRASLALWLGHPAADVDYLQDLLWAYCDDWTWVMAAHEGCAIDLGAVAIGTTLAEILHVLGEQLETEVKERVVAAVERNIFEPFWNYHHLDMWKTCRMNWNHVCNGEIVRTALYLIDDPNVLAHMTHAAIQNMTYALDGFTDDGGCEEGPGYWGYGFGNFLAAAFALYRKTEGEINLMRDASGKIERICRYPLAAHIDGTLRSTFADSGHGHTPLMPALIINQFHDLPELFALCELNSDRTLHARGMHELALVPETPIEASCDDQDYCLPDLGQVKLRGAPGENCLTVMCLAGNNGVNHNHNDIGSFIVHKHGFLPLVDPGAPIYTRDTFGPKRYENVFCSALGHSLPIVDGVLQPAGKDYFGVLRCENLNGRGIKKAVVDMTRAYPEGTVRNLVRTFTLDAAANALLLEDAFVFDRPPKALEEGFVTFEENLRVEGGAVTIAGEKGAVVLAAENVEGHFEATPMPEASAAGKSGRVLCRIRFIPARLERDMRLRFRIA